MHFSFKIRGAKAELPFYRRLLVCILIGTFSFPLNFVAHIITKIKCMLKLICACAFLTQNPGGGRCFPCMRPCQRDAHKNFGFETKISTTVDAESGFNAAPSSRLSGTKSTP